MWPFEYTPEAYMLTFFDDPGFANKRLNFFYFRNFIERQESLNLFSFIDYHRGRIGWHGYRWWVQRAACLHYLSSLRSSAGKPNSRKKIGMGVVLYTKRINLALEKSILMRISRCLVNLLDITRHCWNLIYSWRWVPASLFCIANFIKENLYRI